MDADALLPVLLGLLHHVDDLVQVHQGAVVDLGALLVAGEDLGIHQRASVDDHVSLVDEPLALECEQLGVARTRTDE